MVPGLGSRSAAGKAQVWEFWRTRARVNQFYDYKHWYRGFLASNPTVSFAPMYRAATELERGYCKHHVSIAHREAQLCVGRLHASR